MILFRFLYLVLILLFLSSFSFGACASSVDYALVYSGNTLVGNLSNLENAYLKTDVNSYGVKLELFLKSTQSGCFDSSNSQYQFGNSGYNSLSLVTESKLDNSTFLTKATLDLSNQLPYTYSDSSSISFNFIFGNVISSSYTLGFDSTGPIININSQSDNLNGELLSLTGAKIKSGEEISFRVEAQDSKSGLASIVVTGPNGISKYYNSSKENEIIDFASVLNSNSQYVITATDILGNTNSIEVDISVDSDLPLISDFDFEYSFDNKRWANAVVYVSDASFDINSNPQVYFDLSSINPNANNVLATCSYSLDRINSFLCKTVKIELSMTQSNNYDVLITATDSYGHTSNLSVSEMVEIDTYAPEILDFYLVNRIGEKNIVSAFDDNVSIVLNFKDSSISNIDSSRTFGVFEDFGKLGLALPDPNCETIVSENRVNCIYDVSDSISVYQAFDSFKDNFSVEIIDIYGNSATSQFVLTIDNVNPKIDLIEIVETTSFKDSIVQSGERINFKIYITEENLGDITNPNVRADFSNIDYSSDMENYEGLCISWNSTSYECNFNGVVVENGYFNRTVNFYVADQVGNLVFKNFSIEVLQVGNEVSSSFKINDLNPLSPINRNVMKTVGGVFWHEGQIETVDSQMRIVSYTLRGCNISEIDPLLIAANSIGLYPSDVVINTGQENSEIFAMKSELRSHQFGNDLNDKSMKCYMGILKRDATSLYPEEVVDFNIKYSFEGKLTGDILREHTENILDDIEKAQALGSWFDSLFSVYDAMYKVCSGLTAAANIYNGATSLFVLPNLYEAPTDVYKGYSATGKTGAGVETGKQGMMHIITDREGIVAKMCNVVTCQYGGLLGGISDLADKDIAGFSTVARGIEGLQRVQNDVSQTLNPFCAIGTSSTQEEIPEGFTTTDAQANQIAQSLQPANYEEESLGNVDEGDGE